MESKEAQRRLEHQEMRSILHPTKIEKNRIAVLPAVNVLPPNSLPEWKIHPLEKKFPLVPAPDGEFSIARNALGENIFIPSKCFDLDDPLFLATPRGYESLHDPNLKSYFLSHPDVFRKLHQQGIIEADGSVKAELRDFNTYRAYLSRLRNCVLKKDIEYQDNLASAQRSQMRTIAGNAVRAVRAVQEKKKAKHLENLRRERQRKELAAQLKDVRYCVHSTAKEREVALLAVKREAIREKVRTRLAQLKKAEKRRAKKLIIDWYCKQLYADMTRKARMDHKRTEKKKDLESFVQAKREFQEKKLQWLSNLQQKRDAEKECAAKHRIAMYDRMEDGRMERMKLKAMEEQVKARRQVYLARKFGMKWLTIVRQQQEYAKNYHESVWRVRQQLGEMVNELRNQSGKVNFTSFIKGLISMKPGGKKSIQMTEETRDIINYILDTLIQSALDTYRKQHRPCDKAYDKLGNRRRILGARDLTEDDFKEPNYTPREKIFVPFLKPAHPCKVETDSSFGRGPCLRDEEEMYDEAEQLACGEFTRIWGASDGRRGSRGTDGSSNVAEELVSQSLAKVAGKGFGEKHRTRKDGRSASHPDSSKDRGSGDKKKRPGELTDKSSAPAKGKKSRVVVVSKPSHKTSPPSTDSSTAAERISKAAIQRSLTRLGKRAPDESDDGSSDVAERISKAAIQRSLTRLGKRAPDESDDGSSAVAENLVTKSIRSIAGIKGTGGEGVDRSDRDSDGYSGSDEDRDSVHEEGEPNVTSSGTKVGEDRETSATAASSEETPNLVPSSITGAFTDVTNPEEEVEKQPSTWKTEPSTSTSEDAAKLVAKSLGDTVKDLKCDEPEFSEKDFESGQQPRTGRSDSTPASSDDATKVTTHAIKKAVNDLTCPEDENVPRKRFVPGDDDGQQDPNQKSGSRLLPPTATSSSSDDAVKAVTGAMKRAALSLVCDEPEPSKKDFESGQQPRTGRSDSTAASSDDAAKVTTHAIKKAVGSLTCPEDASNSQIRFAPGGGDGQQDPNQKPEPRHLPPTATSGSSDDAVKAVTGALKHAASSLACDDFEPEKTSPPAAYGEPGSGRSMGSSGKDSEDARLLVSKSIQKACTALTCEDKADKKVPQWESPFDNDVSKLVKGLPGSGGSDSIPSASSRSTGSSKGDSDGAEALVGKSIGKACTDLTCDDEEGKKKLTPRKSGEKLDMGRAGSDTTTTATPGSEERPTYPVGPSCSMLEIMAKQMASSVVPLESVSSSFFNDIQKTHHYSGPVFPLNTTTTRSEDASVLPEQAIDSLSCVDNPPGSSSGFLPDINSSLVFTTSSHEAETAVKGAVSRAMDSIEDRGSPTSPDDVKLTGVGGSRLCSSGSKILERVDDPPGIVRERSCSMLEIMAKQMANNVLPPESVSSSFFNDIQKTHHYSGPVFPLNMTTTSSEDAGLLTEQALMKAIDSLSCDDKPLGSSSGFLPDINSSLVFTTSSQDTETPMKGAVSRAVDSIEDRGSPASPDDVMLTGVGGSRLCSSRSKMLERVDDPPGIDRERSCSMLENMAKQMANSVLPPGSATSSFFSHTQETDHYSGPAFPLNTTIPSSAPVVGASAKSRSIGTAQPPSQTTAACRTERLPSDASEQVMRENVIRTLSNVQHQLDAIRQELRKYGVEPKPTPGGPTE